MTREAHHESTNAGSQIHQGTNPSRCPDVVVDMNITRRTVLGAAATVPVAAMSTAHGAPVASGPTKADWADLAAAMRGTVALPGTAKYTRRARLFDPRWDSRTPAAVARVVEAEDVATCVEFAREHDLKVTARSGGHSYTGASARNDALVIDTRSMTSTSVASDGSAARVDPGANLYAVYEALSKKSVTIPAGTCPTVGVSGLSLVGGLGVDSRKAGLTADNLLQATVIDGTGRIRRVDDDTDADLFWALRGGGAGVGIVTSLKYTTMTAPKRGFFSLSFAGSRAVRVIKRWGTWMADQPRDTWANVQLNSSGGSLTVRVFGVCPAGKEDARADSLRKVMGIAPTSRSTTTRSYLDGVSYLGGGTTTPRTRSVAGSEILPSVTTEAAEAIEEALTSAPSGIAAAAILDPLDGAIADVAKGATAFPWRDHAASVQWYVGMPESPSSSQYATARNWIQKAHGLLDTYTDGGYFGYIESGRTTRDYIGTNTDRLVEVRKTYDPDGVIV